MHPVIGKFTRGMANLQINGGLVGQQNTGEPRYNEHWNSLVIPDIFLYKGKIEYWNLDKQSYLIASGTLLVLTFYKACQNKVPLYLT